MVCILLQMLLYDYELQGNNRDLDLAWNNASRGKMLFSHRLFKKKKKKKRKSF